MYSKNHWLPPQFVEQMHDMLGVEYAAFLEALDSEPIISVRYNNFKAISAALPVGERIPWSSSGYYLPHRPDFAHDPLLYAGAYYVQEAASMMLEQAIRQLVQSPARVLELCAAPGGKTTLLLQTLPQGSAVCANEVIARRFGILAENTAKWGHPNAVLTSADPKDFAQLPSCFDILAVDAPCSGEGMFRKDHGARKMWSEKAVSLCAARQRRIVADAWNALKEGGTLIYSTCTFNTAENEDTLAWIAQHLGAESVPLRVDAAWGAVSTAEISYHTQHKVYGWRCLPHKMGGEGFFIGVMRKISSSPSMRCSFAKKNEVSSGGAQVRKWLQEDAVLRQSGAAVYAFSEESAALYDLVGGTLKSGAVGVVRAAAVGGGSPSPQAPLALSLLLNKDSFPLAALSLDETLTYLRGNALPPTLPATIGYELAAYGGLPLGFLRSNADRRNNLYPKGWRLRQ